MKGRCVALALLLYVSLDFANPMMPGAVTLDESVEGVRAERLRGATPATPPPVSPVQRIEPAPSSPPEARAMLHVAVRLDRSAPWRHAYPPATDPTRPTEDH